MRKRPALSEVIAIVFSAASAVTVASPNGRPETTSTTVPARRAGGASRSAVMSPFTSILRWMRGPPVVNDMADSS